jgi:hypothetical protein
MKLQRIALVACGLALFSVGCGDSPDDAPPAETTTTRLASSLERKLDVPIAIPTDTSIGKVIDDVIEEKSAALTLTAGQPLLQLSASGRKCLVQSFDDAAGHEAMRREKCERDVLRVGTAVYTAATSGRIEHYVDEGAKAYEAFDDNSDGKVDRVIESAERMGAPVALTDFGDVSIIDNGTVASRTREDRDHDGKFDIETITATTRFEVREPKAP